MKLLAPLLALGQGFLSPGQSNRVANNHTVINVSQLRISTCLWLLISLQFDDIPTQAGLANVPSPYHHLNFDLYSVFKPDDPALEGMISKHDLNCAVSSPNALVGSRLYENGHGASFDIANATAMSLEGLQPYFTLRSFYVKPMDAPAPGTTVYVKGYSKAKKEPLVWHIDFPSGYHLPFLVKMEEYSGEEWNEVYKVEITADFGYDALDWEFCIDELEVQFFALSEEEEEARWERHAVLDHAEEI